MRPICKTDEVPVGTILRVELEGLSALAVYNVDGRFFVTDDICSHGEVALSEGWMDGCEIECPWHGGRFDIATGKPTCLPASKPVKTYEVAVNDNNICIAV